MSDDVAISRKWIEAEELSSEVTKEELHHHLKILLAAYDALLARIEQQAATIARLRALVEKAVKVVTSEELKSVTIAALIHGCPYNGPVFPTDEAIAALEEK